MKHRAFTLVEIVIVIMIVAIISVALALSFTESKKHAEFKQVKADVTNIIQQARSLSLANILIDGSGSNQFETDYYLLDFQVDSLTLTAYGTDSHDHPIDSEIDSLEFTSSTGIELDAAVDVYYVPPYGEVCFSYASGCDYDADTDTSKELNLTRDGSDQSASITISIYSGYPEID
jgi:prepilin-type N-terminal cleavage/methylation domain-containing protein